MPNIKSCTDLQSNYNEISALCHETREPIFITKNGQGDLAVMSIEAFEMLNGKYELYRLLDEGKAAVKEGRKRPFANAMKDIKRKIIDGQIYCRAARCFTAANKNAALLMERGVL